jgi:hypothetical protein
MRAEFPHFGSKIVEHSRHLPTMNTKGETMQYGLYVPKFGDETSV